MKYIKIVYLSLLITQGALAWGPNGHRVVGEIAQHHLTPFASARIKALLGNNDHAVAFASTWADEIRNVPQYSAFDRLHYVDILPEFTSYNQFAAEKQDDKDFNANVVQAILELNHFLVNKDPKVFIPIPALSKIDEVTALKLLIHFVGDIHQPLHVIDGNAPDGKSNRGGNTVKVKWLYKYETNLHAVWDNEIIDQEGLSFEDMATVFDQATLEEQAKWLKTSATDWADESLSYRSQVYNLPPGEVPVIWYPYISASREIVIHRLNQAGIRLANLLNQIYK